MKSIGEYLKIKIISSGLSQKAIAARMGRRSPEYLNRVLKNKCIPTLDYIENLSKILGFSIEEIEKETGMKLKREEKRKNIKKIKQTDCSLCHEVILSKMSELVSEVSALKSEVRFLRNEKSKTPENNLEEFHSLSP